MLTHADLKKGVRVLIDGQPHEVLDSNAMKKAQRRVVMQTKIKNLLTGTISERNFHQGDMFEEAELGKFQAKFLYTHRDKFVFCETDNPSKRFELSPTQVGNSANYMRQNEIVEGIMFDDQIVSISLPIKVQLKVKETPPGVKGDRAQGGTKTAVMETGVQVQVPLFINEGDSIEINTETGEYVRRI
jgi:elongation factor P